MPSKQVYKIEFNEETKKFEIQATDESGSLQANFDSPSFDTIEEAGNAMDDLKKEFHHRYENDPFHELVYVSAERFEIINHRG